MRRFIVGGMVVVAAFVPLALAESGASGAAATRSNPPVKMPGRVKNRGTATATGGTVEIDQSDYAFTPTFVKIPAGTTSLMVTVKNVGQNQHTFTVPTQSIDKVLNPGRSVTLTLKVPGRGAIAFACRFHKSLGMQGAFFDKPGAKLIGAAHSKSSGSSGSSRRPSGY